MRALHSDGSRVSYRCPACGGSDFKVWKLPHPVMLHWVLNPGLAVAELLLGQRTPKVELVCKGCVCKVSDHFQIPRSYVPCPSCHAVLSPMLENHGRALGIWRGVECPDCHAAIPCLWNAFSLLILAVTSPLWALPYHFYFKPRPRAKLMHPQVDVGPEPLKRGEWVIYSAIFYALAMWIMMTGIPYLRSDRTPADARKLWSGAAAWSVGGAVYGVIMWRLVRRRGDSGSRANGGNSPKGFC